MANADEMTRLLPQALLDQAREFIHHLTDNSAPSFQQPQDLTGGEPPAFAAVPDRTAPAKLFEFTERLSVAVLAMESHIRVLNRADAERTGGPLVSSNGQHQSSPNPEFDLRAQVEELRDIIGHLLVTAEPSWERGVHSQDWKEAMDRAREALLVGFPE